jgi:hypothetical protein
VLKFEYKRKNLNIGFNRLEKTRYALKGGAIIIHLKIYGMVIDMNVEKEPKRQ